MKIHELKCERPYFTWVKSGDKPFEVRLDDRNYQNLDILHLKEYDKKEDRYIGGECLVQVTHILRAFPGLEKGYCVMAIKLLGVEKE